MRSDLTTHDTTKKKGLFPAGHYGMVLSIETFYCWEGRKEFREWGTKLTVRQNSDVQYWVERKQQEHFTALAENV